VILTTNATLFAIEVFHTADSRFLTQHQLQPRATTMR